LGKTLREAKLDEWISLRPLKCGQCSLPRENHTAEDRSNGTVGSPNQLRRYLSRRIL